MLKKEAILKISRLVSLLFVISFGFITIVATGGGGGGGSDSDSDPLPVDNFAGTYEGEFSGDDYGTFTLEISDNGDITGSAYSTKYSDTEYVTGSIDETGDFSLSGESTDGTTFEGRIASNEVSGAWENSYYNQSGSFSGDKINRGNIRIGVAAPFTGFLAAYGDNIKAGVNLKLKEINGTGGINGQKVELAWGDDLCAPKDAGTVGSQFAADKTIVAVVGHLCSSATLAAMPIYVRAGLPCISPTSTNPTIGDVGKGWFFRNCYTDDFQGKYLASYVVPKLIGKNKVAIFYENNDYAIGLKDSFVAGAKGTGVTVTGAEAYVAKTTDFTPQLTKLLKDNPDTIFLCGYHSEGALIAGQARKLGFDGPLFGADGIDNIDYIKIGGKAADNTYCTVPFFAASAGPAGQAFAENFKKAEDRDVDWMSANAYDCLGILAQVIAKVGPDREKIRDGLAAFNSKENGYKGVTGLTYFDKKGDCSKPPFVKKVKDGQFVPAE